jgi:hypothetical protein
MDQQLLNHSAKTLGEYICESEWQLILNQKRSQTFYVKSEEDFMEQIKGYTYYHAVVCACEGNMEEVQKQLKEDYEDYMNEEVL